ELVPPEISPHMIEYAMKHRPDILQLDYLVRQADSNIGTTKAGFYPAINLSASIDGDRTEDGRFEQDDYGKSVGVSLSYNLFAGGYNRAKVREATAKKAEAERNLENVRISVEADVMSSIVELRSAQEQLALQRSNATLVQRNRDLVEKEYAAGQTSLVRLNEAQRNLITAQSRLALALVSMRQAWQNLEASTGKNLTRVEKPM
ncbi:MAG: TolC family protein, partial [Deltaproteobacteria bacterium]|nr:TolC family protein [Deltaproteobacteria bacterium]